MIFWMFCLSAVFLIRGCAHLHRRSQGRSQRSWSLSLCRSNFSMFQFWSTILGGLTFQKWIWSKCQWRMLERPGILMDPLWGCAMLGCCWGSVQHWRMMLGTHFCLFSSNFKIVFSHQGFAHVSCYGSSASPSTSWVILASFTRDICSPLVVGKQLFHIISLEWGGHLGQFQDFQGSDSTPLLGLRPGRAMTVSFLRWHGLRFGNGWHCHGGVDYPLVNCYITMENHHF